MTRERRDRPGRVPLLALLAAAVLGSLALVLLALRDDGVDSPPATVPAQTGPFRGNRLPDGIRDKRAPSFRLRDVRGGVLDTHQLRGTPYVVTFLYTDCPDVCPLIGQELRQALELLGERSGQVAVVAVSVDPEGDKPEIVQAWLDRHRLPANFHYLIGTDPELKPVWKSYFAAPQQAGSERSLHTASIWLIDGRGRWRTKFSAGVAVPPRDIAHDLRVLLREI